ncbi:MAG TPA: addiction module protein [Pirellulaceae bacterium]|nr:addiction module protein [Pirellulaceae bacterium]
MTQATQQVLQAAMALSDDERAELIVHLEDTMAGFATPEVAAAWDAEIAKRLMEIDDGTVELSPAEEVHRRLGEKYGFFADWISSRGHGRAV